MSPKLPRDRWAGAHGIGVGSDFAQGKPQTPHVQSGDDARDTRGPRRLQEQRECGESLGSCLSQSGDLGWKGVGIAYLEAECRNRHSPPEGEGSKSQAHSPGFLTSRRLWLDVCCGRVVAIPCALAW